MSKIIKTSANHQIHVKIRLRYRINNFKSFIIYKLSKYACSYKLKCSYGNGDPSALNTSKSRTSVFCASVALLCGSIIFIQPPAGKVIAYRWYLDTKIYIGLCLISIYSKITMLTLITSTSSFVFELEQSVVVYGQHSRESGPT